MSDRGSEWLTKKKENIEGKKDSVTRIVICQKCYYIKMHFNSETIYFPVR